MAVLTSYAPLLGGYRSVSSERAWERSGRRTPVADEPATVLPFGGRSAPLRKELPEDLLDERGASTRSRQDSSPLIDAPKERPLRDSEVTFLLDFSAPFLRAVSQLQSPSDVVFRERAVYWDLAPARAAYGKLLYRQNSFFVNRRQDAALGTNLNSFW